MTDTASSEPKGLGGWLVLVAIGLVFSSLRLLVILIQTFLPILRDGTWGILTTPGSDAYHPLWAPLLIFEIVTNIGFIAAQLWLVFLFFNRSRMFPKLYVWVALLNLPFILVDAWLGSFVVTDQPMIDPDTAKELVRSIATIAIWVPYMFKSRRVRNTFVA